MGRNNSALTGKLALILSLCIAITPIVYFIITNKLTYGGIAILGIIGLGVVLVSFINPDRGFIICFIYSSFIFLVSRLIGREDIPYGAVRDILLFIILLGIIIKRRQAPTRLWFKPGTIFITYSIFTLYLFIQILNPEGTLRGWAFGMRTYISYFVTYLVLLYFLRDLGMVKRFTKLWLAIFLLGALYCFYQEWVGLPAFDLRWVTATPERIGLNFQAGRWDLWSFFADVAVFGLAMPFGGLFCLILATGPFSKKRKIVLIISAAAMFLAAFYSGNRTGYATIPFGVCLFALLTIDNPKTILIAGTVAAFFVILVFGPFYGPSINKFRSTFFPTEDASFQLRDRNRSYVQPYIHEHPLGGGFMSTGTPGMKYSPNHELAGFPPDSLYLQTAMEFGWIGLLFQVVFYFLIVSKGAINYFKVQNPKLKIILMAYTCCFFALSIGGYAQTAIFQIPLGFILVATYVLVENSTQLDEP